MKDVANCEKRRGVVSKLWSGDVWIGKPSASNIAELQTEYIGLQSKLRELKHLSTWRKKKKLSIPPVVASEKGTV